MLIHGLFLTPKLKLNIAHSKIDDSERVARTSTKQSPTCIKRTLSAKLLWRAQTSGPFFFVGCRLTTRKTNSSNSTQNCCGVREHSSARFSSSRSMPSNQLWWLGELRGGNTERNEFWMTWTFVHVTSVMISWFLFMISFGSKKLESSWSILPIYYFCLVSNNFISTVMTHLNCFVWGVTLCREHLFTTESIRTVIIHGSKSFINFHNIRSIFFPCRQEQTPARRTRRREEDETS